MGHYFSFACVFIIVMCDFALIDCVQESCSGKSDDKFCTGPDDEHSGSCTPISEFEVHILLIGKAGAGKSTTGNTILGRRAFDTSASVDAVTMNTQRECADRFDRDLCVIDTPGLFDTSRTNEEVMNEITKWHLHASDVVHAVVLVVEVGRYTEEDQQCENFFREHFGHDIMNFVIVAFTGKNNLDNDNINIETFISNIKSNSALRLLLNEVKDRYIVLGLENDNNEQTSKLTTTKENVNEVKRLLKVIRTVGQVNKGKYYTKDKMRVAQELLRNVKEDKRLTIENEKKKEIDEKLELEKQKQNQESQRLKDELEQKEDENRKRMEKLAEDQEKAEDEKKMLEAKLREQRNKMQLEQERG